MISTHCLVIASIFASLSIASLVRGDDAAERLVLATYKLANESSTATGVVVRHGADDNARKFVVTANHVLDQMRGDSCKLVSRTHQADGMYQRNEIRISIRSESGKPLWTRHAHHDLAVLPLPKSIKVEALAFECLATEMQMAKVHTGDAVRAAVFPERSEANNAGFPILRGGSVASFPITPIKTHPMFLVDATSWKGDSGGPVIHHTLRSPRGGPVVIGIVRGMRSISDTVRESRFVQRRTDYPLGVSEVLHAALVRELIAGQVAK